MGEAGESTSVQNSRLGLGETYCPHWYQFQLYLSLQLMLFTSRHLLSLSRKLPKTSFWLLAFLTRCFPLSIYSWVGWDTFPADRKFLYATCARASAPLLPCRPSRKLLCLMAILEEFRFRCLITLLKPWFVAAMFVVMDKSVSWPVVWG